MNYQPCIVVEFQIINSHLIELVKTGTKFNQQSHDVRVAIVRGNHQRRVVLHVG